MKKALLLSIIISFCGFLISSLAISHMPSSIPIHWSIDGTVNGYGNPYTLFIFPTITLILSILLFYLPKIDPKGSNIEKSGYLLPTMMIFLAVLMLVVEIMVILAVGKQGSEALVFILPGMVGILFIIMGVELPKVKPNYTMGIRTPWTLASEKVWVQTHKASKQWFEVTGILFLLGTFMKPVYGIIMPTIFAFMTITGITIYSYYLYQKENKNSN